MINPTKAIYAEIKKRYIPIATISRETGLPAKPLYESLSEKGKRMLKADELLLICKFLGINPMELINDGKPA